MAEPWNLTPDEWSEVLDTKSSVHKTAQDLKKGKFLPWVEVLLESTSASEKILDLGSGAGQNSAILALQHRHTTLLDWSKENIDFSKELFNALNINGQFLWADMTQKLQFMDDSFDTVFSCGVFEYFNDKQIIEILKEALRITKKQVIIMVPNASSIPYRLGMAYKRFRKQWQWGGERPFYSLKPYFKRAGIYKIKEFSVGAKHSLKFLTTPLGDSLKKLLIKSLKLKDHSNPSFFNQGYLLITIAKKEKN